jgi:predicted deacylase
MRLSKCDVVVDMHSGGDASTFAIVKVGVVAVLLLWCLYEL